MSETPALELQIRDNSAEVVKALDNLASVLGRVQSAVGNSAGYDKVAKDIDKLSAALTNAVPEESVSRMERMADAVERLKSAGQGITINIKGLSDANNPVSSMMESAQTAIQETVEPMQRGLEVMQFSMAEATQTIEEQSQNAVPNIEALESAQRRVNETVEEMAPAARNAAQATEEHTKAVRKAGREANRSSGLIGKLAHSFGRILMYRAIRTMIKQITEGFKLGIANVREYSKAIGSGFYKAMDAANNATFKMKNSLGAALAPALQALIPILIQVVNWVIQAANYFNQFISLVAGATSWTRATDATANSMEKVKKQTGGAAKEMKNLLADWDELNIIQSQSGGGSGGAGGYEAIDYSSMFEQVDVFDERIKNIVNWIKANFKDILATVKGIGAAMIAWSVTKDVSSIFNKIVAGAITAGLEFYLIYDATKTMLSDGFSWGSFFESIVGLLVGTYGIWKITGSWKLGLIVGTTIAVAATISAIYAVKKQSEKQMANRMFRQGGSSGINVGALFAAIQSEFNAIASKYDLTITYGEKATEIKSNIPSLVANLNELNAVLFGSGAPSKEDAAKFKEVWNQVNDTFDELVKADFSVLFSGLTSAFSSANEELRKQALETRKNLLIVQKGITEAEAKLRVQFEEVENRILSGSATDEDEKFYLNYMKRMAEVSGAAMTEFDNAWKDFEQNGINFSTADEAVQFLSNLTAAGNEAASEAQKALDQAGNAYKDLVKVLNFELDSGAINDGQYEKAFATLTDAFNAEVAIHNEDVDRIAEQLRKVYLKVFQQANEGLEQQAKSGASYDVLSAYIDNVITPIANKLSSQTGLFDEKQINFLTEYPAALKNALYASRGYANDITRFSADVVDAVGGLIGTGTVGDLEDLVGGTDEMNNAFLNSAIEFIKNQQIEPTIEIPGHIVIDPVEVDPVDIGQVSSDISDASFEYTYDTGDIQSIYNALREALFDYDSSQHGSSADYYNNVLDPIVRDIFASAGLEKGAGKLAAEFYDIFWQSLNNDPDEELTPDFMIYSLQQAIKDAKIDAIDTSKLTDGLSNASASVSSSVNSIIDSVKKLDGLSFSFTGGFMGGAFSVAMPAFAAEGGMFTAGQMFVAREAGPEMIGRMGNKSTVANNDQIVAGISSGVASGQEEQNALLRRQNDLLTQLLNKKFVAEAVPSSEWGAHNRKSNELYQRRTGVSV